MIPLRISSHRIIVSAVVALAALLLVGVFVTQARGQMLFLRIASAPTELKSVSAYSGVPLVGSGSLVQNEPMREVHIANNGLVLLRGARVTSIGGNVIHVGITWGTSNVTWAVATTQFTKFLTPAGEKGGLEDIRIGDIVTVTGSLVASGIEPTVDTDIVREQEAQ